MATNFGGKIAYPPSFVALAFRNGLRNRNSGFKILNGNNFCTLYKFDEIRSSNSGVHEVTN